MSKKLEIARISQIPDIMLTDGKPPQRELSKVHISKQTLAKYHDAMNPRLPFFHRLRRFLSAQNEAGRIAKTIKDFALIFVPYGGQIKTLESFVTERIKPKTENNMNWIANRLKEKSTWRGIVAALTAIGVSISPGQAAAIVTLGVAVAGAFEVFFKEPQSSDAK